jgi:GxxExxY protein
MRDINKITYDIRGAAFKVHTALGPGLLELAYEACLCYELEQLGYQVRRQVGLPLIYHTVNMKIGYRIDLLVNDTIIVEIKAVKALTPVDTAQILTYLKLSKKKIGLLLNFHEEHMRNGIKRYIL